MGNRTLRTLACIILAVITILTMLQTQGPRANSPDQADSIATVPSPSTGTLEQTIGLAGYQFIENIGQVQNDRIRFYAEGDPLSIGIVPNGLVFVQKAPIEGDRARLVTSTLTFEGGREVQPVGRGAAGCLNHFYYGNDPARWVHGAMAFPEITMEDVYDGVDVRFYFSEGRFKYDIDISQGAELASVVLAYEGVECLGIDPITGDLLASTAAGSLRDARPIVIQRANDGNDGQRLSNFMLLGNNRVAFSLPDGIDESRPFTVDPGIEFSTLCGGMQDEYLFAVKEDSQGNVHVVGRTDSTAIFPKGTGVNYTSMIGDIFGLIIPGLGNPPVTVYRIGGSGSETPLNLFVMPGDRMFIGGSTYSPDFPLVDELDSTQEWDEAFLLSLNWNASTLLFSSYFGGNNRDYILGFNADDDGNLYLHGRTYSDDLPCTSGAFCRTMQFPSFSGGFVARFTSTPTALAYCTYIDGDGNDACMDVTVDADGRLYIVGNTDSRPTGSFDMPPGAYESSRFLYDDGYIIVLDPTGSTIEHGTFLGGNYMDGCTSIVLSSIGDVIVVGITTSDDFPTTDGAFSRQLGGTTGVYLSVLDSTLSTLVMSTFFGGSTYDTVNRIVLSEMADRAFMTGYTESTDLPVSDGTFDPIHRGFTDAYLTAFNTTTWRPVYCTYIGGAGNESIGQYGISQGTSGSLLLCGQTTSPDFPTTSDAYSTNLSGGTDGFLMRLNLSPLDISPGPPRDLKVTTGDHIASLTWCPPQFKEAQVIGYSVYRTNTTQGGPLQKVARLAWSQTSFVDSLSINGQDYHYSLSAENSAFEGSRCNPVLAHPLGRPTAPRGLGWETGGGTVNLSWDPPLDNGGQLDGYYVLRGDDAADIDKTVGVLGGGDTIWIDPDVQTGLHYYYLILAFNPIGNSTSSNIADALPLDRPSKPTNVTATADNEEVRLRWEQPASDGGSRIGGYRIWWGIAKDNPPYSVPIEPTQHDYLHSGLTNGQPYFYYIEVVNANGTSDRETPNNFPATPFGRSSPPRELDAKPGNGWVILTWKAPSDNNGAPVEHYIVHISTTGSSFNQHSDRIFDTAYNYTGAINDVKYFFKVTALNPGGESPASNIVNATPMAIPNAPSSLTAKSVKAGIQLDWMAPDWTGAYPLVYIIQKGPSEQKLEDLSYPVYIGTTYLDTDALLGHLYYYKVRARNAADNEGDPSNLAWETRATIPGDVFNLTIGDGDGEVVLSWAPPMDDGGSMVMSYNVYRGANTTTMVLVHTVQVRSQIWTDKGLINGQNYTYAVMAVNDVGEALLNQTAPGRPRANCGMVILQPIRYKDGKVIFKWTLPDYPDRLPPVSFVIYKGRLASSMEPVATLDPSASGWVDDSVDDGTTYYYIQSISSRGPGARTDTVPFSPPPDGFGWLPILIIIILAAIVTLMAMSIRRRRVVGAAETGKVSGDLIVEVGTTGIPAAGAASVATSPRHLVEEIFVIYKDGRLIAECSRDTCKTADADLMSGMLIAVQGIVQEGLHKGGELESIKYGDSLIVIKTGAHLNVAAIIYGEPDAALNEELEATVERIEVSYSGVIEHWDGDLTPLSGMTDMVMPLFEKTATITRADIKGPAPTPAVSLLSSIDFHRGYVRLKLAVVNATKESVTDASIEVHYDHDMLRLERVIPVSLDVRGDSIILGNIRPEERKSVALLLDPQICHGTHLDGTLVYYDPKGELHRVEMKRRRADVVCPIFFTKTHANTAMLRRLIKEKLHNSDVRAFRYPEGLAPASLLDLGRRALAGNAIQMVRQYIREGPSYCAEVWYYGETKVKGHQIVMRLGVIDEKRAFEFFAASTDMEPITGLLADFKRELDRLFVESHPGKPPMVPLRSEAVLGEIEGRTLLIDERDGPIVE